MAVLEVSVHSWTRAEYESLVDSGFFGPEGRVELVSGIVYDMSPQNSLHATVLYLAEEALRQVFGVGWMVRCQMPLALSEDSEPEPDLAVVAGKPLEFLQAHPSTAALIVEVAGTSLLHDRQRKALLYAQTGIPEYWLLRTAESQLEVFRDPSPQGYRSRTVLERHDTLSPLARPEVSLPVATLFP
jgi:Uma2 family endonuclease